MTQIEAHVRSLQERVKAIPGSRRERAKLLGVPEPTLRWFERDTKLGVTASTVHTIELALVAIERVYADIERHAA